MEQHLDFDEVQGVLCLLTLLFVSSISQLVCLLNDKVELAGQVSDLASQVNACCHKNEGSVVLKGILGVVTLEVKLCHPYCVHADVKFVFVFD